MRFLETWCISGEDAAGDAIATAPFSSSGTVGAACLHRQHAGARRLRVVTGLRGAMGCGKV